MARTITLKNALLSAYNAEDLNKIAEEMHLDGGNDALSAASVIAEKMLNETYFKEKLLLMTEDDVQFLRQAVSVGHDFIPAPSQYRQADDQMDGLLCYRTADTDHFVVPFDAAEAFRKTDTADFREYQKKTAWTVRCMRLIPAIYIAVSLEDFEKLFRRKREYRSLKHEEIMKLLQKTASIEGAPCVISNNLVIAAKLFESGVWEKAVRGQSSDPAAIPSYTEIMDLSSYGWAVHEKAWQFFCRYLISELSFSEDYADLICQISYMNLAAEQSFQQLLKDLKDYGVVIKEADQRKTEVLLKECFAVTRLQSCHGQRYCDSQEYRSLLMQNNRFFY